MLCFLSSIFRQKKAFQKEFLWTFTDLPLQLLKSVGFSDPQPLPEARQLDEFGQVPRQHRADPGRREGLVSRLENQGAAVFRG